MRTTTAVRTLCVIWAVAALASAAGALAQSREELARELLEITGAGKMGVQVMNQMIETMKPANPRVPQEFWDEFMAEVDPDELTELAMPIYTRHLTAEEMSAAIAFYRTPAGQSLLRKMPIIMQESMAAGQEWGMKLGQSIAERLERWKRANPDA